MLIETAVTAGLGALICLDRVAVQVMISRPVAAGPLIGLVLGDALTGILTGALLELLWIDRAPIGPYVPPHETFVSILATAGSILAAPTGAAPPRELIALSILLFAPAAWLGQRMETILRQWNERWVHRALEDAKAGDPVMLSRRHLTALAGYFAASLLCLGAAMLCGVPLLKALYPLLPPAILQVLALAYLLLPLIGIGVALHTVKLRGAVPVFCGVFLLLALASEFL
ncbi:MAG TPA: PTS sugar transporter subunit IIC [Syntrophales bacterium]|nr:PTS sugar transporter subunit IIC [Syntrophales bacterium]